MVQWNLITKMTIEVGREFDMCIYDIMLNHSYLLLGNMYNKQRIKNYARHNLALHFYGS